jgi:hypothetical protein
MFFRPLQHLLPDAAAWRTTTQKTLRRYLEGLAAGHEDARTFIDAVYEDLAPETTRELAKWETQFGLSARGDETERRQQLAAAWRAQGGQSPRYLQDVVQAAGFDLYIHEWWEPGTTPRVRRDPRDYTEQPRVGTTQSGEAQAQCGEPDAVCNRWLVNEVRYLVNKNLTRVAPPPVPSDPARWPYFLYWSGETFPEPASIPASRRDELERLLLKICPAHLWLVVIAEYT